MLYAGDTSNYNHCSVSSSRGIILTSLKSLIWLFSYLPCICIRIFLILYFFGMNMYSLSLSPVCFSYLILSLNAKACSLFSHQYLSFLSLIFCILYSKCITHLGFILAISESITIHSKDPKREHFENIVEKGKKNMYFLLLQCVVPHQSLQKSSLELQFIY